MGARESPPGPPPGGRLSATQRREQLLACAVKVFARHGLEAGSHVLVAAEAGVSVPLCFFHFKTRDALVDAVLTEVERLYHAAFALADDDTLDARVALKRTSDLLVEAMDAEHPASPMMTIFIEWRIAVRSSLWPRYLRLHRHIVGVLARVIARGQRQGHFRPELNAEDEAELLHAASFALAQLRLTGASARRIARFQESMFRVIRIDP